MKHSLIIKSALKTYEKGDNGKKVGKTSKIDRRDFINGVSFPEQPEHE